MTSFAILIQADISQLATHRHAWQLAKAMVASGHQLPLVFFSGAAVAVGLVSADPAANEWAPGISWQQLVESYPSSQLVICSSAGQRLGAGEAQLRPGFRLGGLGEWVTTSTTVDKVIQWR